MLIKSDIESKLDEEITASLDKLKDLKDDPKEYDIVVARIAKLKELKTESRLKLPSLDTVLIVSANIFGIVYLARFERENVITSPKAFGFIPKLPR